MDPNGKSIVPGDVSSEKSHGPNVFSSTATIKHSETTTMSSNGKSVASGDVNSNKSKSQNDVSITGLMKRSVKPTALSINEGGRKGVSSKADSGVSASTKRKGKEVVTSHPVVLFRDVKLGPQEGQVRFRLIHFWEARKPLTKVLIGLEMLLIDEEGTAIQGFITPGRMATYLPHMIAGAVYRLTNFYGSHNKDNYRVAEPSVTISFSWNSVLSIIEDSSLHFPNDRFRFHRYEDFEANCDLRGDLYDFVGHIKLVNGQNLTESLAFHEEELASSRRILLHVQTYDGPVMKLYLWEKPATSFLEKFRAHGSCPSVILVTTLNPKRIEGTLTLNTLSPSRVFINTDVEPTREYMAWLSSNLDVANRVNPEVVTKSETVTIGDLLSYVKQAGSQVARFECEATVDDVVHGTPWYYIGCGACHTKATKGPTTLMCKKCGKAEIIGVAQYLTKLSVYDHTDQATFVLLGDAGFELTRKKASQLVDDYFEANENAVGDDHLVPVPQALIDTIGQTRKFIVKVTNLNLTGQVQSLIVTKVLPPQVQEPEADLEEDVIAPAADEPQQMGNHEDGPSDGHKEAGDGSVKRSADIAETDGIKRPRSV